jgi:hypothetical protein
MGANTGGGTGGSQPWVKEAQSVQFRKAVAGLGLELGEGPAKKIDGPLHNNNAVHLLYL